MDKIEVAPYTTARTLNDQNAIANRRIAIYKATKGARKAIRASKTDHVNGISDYRNYDYMTPDYNYDVFKSTFSRKSNDSIRLEDGEKPIGDPAAFASVLSDMNHTFLMAETHLTVAGSRLDNIVYTINNRVSTSDNILFLGSMLAPSSYKNVSLIMQLNRLIRTPNKYLILGDTDKYSLQAYKELGFKYITDRAEKTVGKKKVVYTYYPIYNSNYDMNIFGYSNAYSYHYKSFLSANKYFCVSAGNGGTQLYNLGDIIRGEV